MLLGQERKVDSNVDFLLVCLICLPEIASLDIFCLGFKSSSGSNYFHNGKPGISNKKCVVPKKSSVLHSSYCCVSSDKKRKSLCDCECDSHVTSWGPVGLLWEVSEVKRGHFLVLTLVLVITSSKLTVDTA